MKTRMIKATKLFVDPDVQLAFALQESRWRHMAETWDPYRVIVLVVVPDGKGGFSIIDGRHRFLAGTAAGIASFTCQVHDEVTFSDVPAKARLKLGIDSDRRRVSALERFLIRVMSCDPIATDMVRIAHQAGFKIAKPLKNAMDSRVIESVVALESIYTRIGADGFHRVLALNSHWRDDPEANHSVWLGGLATFVREGFDQRLDDEKLARLHRVVPAEANRYARGEMARKSIHDGRSGGEGASFRLVHVIVANHLRRKVGIPLTRGHLKVA